MLFLGSRNNFFFFYNFFPFFWEIYVNMYVYTNYAIKIIRGGNNKKLLHSNISNPQHANLWLRFLPTPSNPMQSTRAFSIMAARTSGGVRILNRIPLVGSTNTSVQNDCTPMSHLLAGAVRSNDVKCSLVPVVSTICLKYKRMIIEIKMVITRTFNHKILKSYTAVSTLFLTKTTTTKLLDYSTIFHPKCIQLCIPS